MPKSSKILHSAGPRALNALSMGCVDISPAPFVTVFCHLLESYSKAPLYPFTNIRSVECCDEI